MRKKLNESFRLNVAAAKKQAKAEGLDPIDFNALMDRLEEDGAEISQEGNCAIMVIDGVSELVVRAAIDDLYDEDEVFDIVNDMLDCHSDNVDSNEELLDAFDNELRESKRAKGNKLNEKFGWRDVLNALKPLNFEEDSEDEEKVYKRNSKEINQLSRRHHIEESIEADGLEELKLALSNAEQAGLDGISFENEVVLDSDLNDDVELVVYSIDINGLMETNVGDVDIEELNDEDDFYTLADLVNDYVNNDTLDFPDYDEVELPRYEKMLRGHHLEEKKKGCCPGRPGLHESFKAANEKDFIKLRASEDAVKKVFDDIDKQALSAEEAKDALKKLKIENKKLAKIELKNGETAAVSEMPGFKKAMKKLKASGIKESDYEKFEMELTSKVDKALKENKEYLHGNIRVNGKSFKDMSLAELKTLYNKVLSEKTNLTNELKNELNESTKVNLNKKNLLLEFIDQEITYRETRNACLAKLNEDGEISDEELANLFGPAQGEDSQEDSQEASQEDSEEVKKDDESSEDTNAEAEEDDVEEVELARVEITLKSREAAEALIDACKEAGIDEDAMELEGNEEESDEESEEENSENNEEESSENEEESEDEETSDAEESNESVYYGNIMRLLNEGEDNSTEESDEADENSDDASNDNEEESEETSEEDNTEETSEEESDEEQVKFVLTNTDFVPVLAKVLEDQYGISKEEFEEMIGGEIVEDEESDEDEEATEETNDDNSDKNEDSSDEEKEDKEEDKEEDIDPSELFAGF